jgi:hypothetical protein
MTSSAPGTVMTKGQPATPSAVEVFGPDEPHDRVDQERRERARDGVGPHLDGLLVHPVVGARGKRASLAGLEVHHVAPDGFPA